MIDSYWYRIFKLNPSRSVAILQEDVYDGANCIA